ncbi:uncharacterized protein SAPINGB_P001483 [Magnusiomyces paraingens]|uniref:Transcription elongation factor SPT5 n=1 Tax=Magnusiomyces paraingens TaxID=2606893 RepID=A0A5E8BC31_9ASCO|nr:uncharacterized protein SAPINGB_P001483 [Saprochaete ingens]VVT46978.1 unnamed protein product [Saprochaete ingens]
MPRDDEQDNYDSDGEVQETLKKDKKRSHSDGEEEPEIKDDVNEDEEEDEEEDEDEEEEEEEEEIGPSRRKRPRREARNQFLDVEAEVDEDEEDYEEDEEGLLREDGFIQEDDHADYDEVSATDDRLHREVDRRREAIVEEDAEKLASEYKEKYGRSTASKYRGDTGNVPQHLLLPSVQDPNIWGIRCKPGKERELVRMILKKKINLQNTKSPLEIFSVFQRDGFMGYIYIEARKVTAVDHALKGLVNVYGSSKILVPIKEYTDLLRVNKSKEQELTPGTYVRIKRGKYQGDLAIVENLSENGLEARLKVVPRLDYGRTAALNADGKKRPNINSAKHRPPPRLFSELDAVQHDQRNLSKRGLKSFIYHNETYEDGFLIKDYKLTFLTTENVMPSLEELQRFNGASDEGIDLSTLSQTLKNDRSNVSFQTGDNVELFTGEQAGVQGRVMSIQGEIVTLKATTGPLRGQTFDAPASNLRKRFQIGEHVRVASGNYSGETGMVVDISKDNVTIVSDSSKKEITVFSRDLQDASDIGGSSNTSEDYELLNLVQLNAQTVGCIIRVDRDTLSVLTQEGAVKTVPTSSIIMKITNKRQFATDRDGQEIRVGDTVKEMYGEGRTGVILHIHRRFLFLQDRNTTENLGVFVASINSVTTVAVKGARVDVNKRNEFGQQQSHNPSYSFNRGGNNNGNNQRNGTGVPIKQGGRDRVIGKTVTIGAGSQYKGFKGIVKDATEDTARVELHARNKVVTVKKQQLLFSDAHGKLVSYTDFVVPAKLRHLTQPSRGGEQGGWAGGRTPAWNAGGGGGRTPGWADGGRTPAAGGGRTPGYRAGGATPNWNGSKTPSWGGSGSGHKTPAYGESGRYSSWGGNNDGGRTPAWNTGSRTPGYASSGRSSTWDAGSRTPAAGSSGAMSTWDANSSMNSNRNNDYGNDRARSWYDSSKGNGSHGGHGRGHSGADMTAPTPGASAATPHFAETPGAFSAPTPGVFQNDFDTAPTPGVFDAKTPGAAPTPAAWGSAHDAETPRFEPGTP